MIGLGFLSGLFTAIGIDQQDEIIRIIRIRSTRCILIRRMRYLFFTPPAILLLVSVLAAYLKGGV